MDFTEGTALEIVERLCSAYGVTTQKALAESIGVPAANVSNWVQRDSVPGSAFVKCALDTGSDLYWLTTGKLANAKSNVKVKGDIGQGKALYDEIMSNGGKPVLRRIMVAYGFTLQKQLCDLLDISSGTVSTWIRRGYFPGDVVVTCALDTGVSLQWLATGEGAQVSECTKENNVSSIVRKNLSAGILHDASRWNIDLSFVHHKFIEPVFIFSNKESWVIDFGINDISNGCWLLGIDGKYDIYSTALMPGRKINIKNKLSNFLCSVEDVHVLGKVVLSMNYEIQ